MTTRSRHGSGAIRERAGRPGLYEGRYYGRDGRRRSVYGSTKKEVADKLRDAMSADRDRLPVTPARLTVAGYLERWLAEVSASRRPRTAESYAFVVRRYIIPTIGSVRLGDLEKTDVLRLLAEVKQRRDARGRALSPTTVRYCYAVLRIALGRAVKDEIVKRNVAALVDPPQKASRRADPLTLEQAHGFLESVAGTRNEALYVAAMMTGLRQGELLALRWEDVDLEGRALRVRHTLQRGARTLAEPKTPRSNRVRSFGATLEEALRRHRVRQNEDRLLAGPGWQDLGFVFTTPLGRPLDGVNVTHDFQDALARAGLPRQRFHDLRHLNATLELEAGTPMEVVSRNLGHSSIRTTVDVYGHLTTEMQRAAVARLEARLGSRREGVG